jgi:hypothetical protein
MTASQATAPIWDEINADKSDADHRAGAAVVTFVPPMRVVVAMLPPVLDGERNPDATPLA